MIGPGPGLGVGPQAIGAFPRVGVDPAMLDAWAQMRAQEEAQQIAASQESQAVQSDYQNLLGNLGGRLTRAGVEKVSPGSLDKIPNFLQRVLMPWTGEADAQAVMEASQAGVTATGGAAAAAPTAPAGVSGAAAAAPVSATPPTGAGAQAPAGASSGGSSVMGAVGTGIGAAATALNAGASISRSGLQPDTLPAGSTGEQARRIGAAEMVSGAAAGASAGAAVGSLAGPPGAVVGGVVGGVAGAIPGAKKVLGKKRKKGDEGGYTWKWY